MLMLRAQFYGRAWYCKTNAKCELMSAPGPKNWSDIKTAFYRGEYYYGF